MTNTFSIGAICLMLIGSAYPAEKTKVKIIDRRNSETSYSYFVPEQAYVNSNANVSCFGSEVSVNCSGSERTTASAIAAHSFGYSVRGATLSLLLPGGRIAVVNCESKYAPRFDYINRRSCRLPLVDDVDVEFHGNKAKLEWAVSLDGKKMESETYQIVAVVGTIAAPSQSPPAPASTKIADVNESANGLSADFADVMTWFDEPAPGPTTEIRNVVITASAYDRVLKVLRTLRDSDTSVKSGMSVLDVDYHPPAYRLGANLSAGQLVDVFRWDNEALADATLVMHIRVTQRVYENVTNAIGHLQLSTFKKE
jgi:hypothetical protein